MLFFRRCFNIFSPSNRLGILSSLFAHRKSKSSAAVVEQRKKCAKVQTQNKYDERESEKYVIQHREKKRETNHFDDWHARNNLKK